jgi:hypothetical protein
MKLSVLTVTCRKDPRFAEMARALFWSFRRAPADSELEWIVVDELLWREDPNERAAPLVAALHSLPADVQARIHVEHFAPPASDLRGPDIADPLPAHNTAANAGILAIDVASSYVCYLADCTCVTGAWVTVALELATKGLGWRCRASSIHDGVIPQNGPLQHQDCHDNFHQVAATTVAGPCWGVPRETLITVGGFDTDYDGEDDLYAHEILLRIGRLPTQFVTTKRAGVLRLNKTRDKNDITTRKETLRPKRNQIFFQHLGQDKTRILPGARAAQTTSTSLAAGSPKALRMADVPPPAPPPRAVPAPRKNAFQPPPRPTSRAAAAETVPPVPGPARPAALEQTVELAEHQSEICGVMGTAGPCIRKMLHYGAHRHGIPLWVQGVDPATFVERYRAAADRRRALENGIEGAEAIDPEHGLKADAVDAELDDLWYVMNDDQRDEVDPDGAETRAAQRQNVAAASQPAEGERPMTLHERARAARDAKRHRAELEKQGKAPAPTGDERCPKIPTQGMYAGLRCLLRKPHGGAHRYPEPGTPEAEGDVAEPLPSPTPKAPVRVKAQPNPGAMAKRVSREPPEPSADVSAVMTRIDEAALEIQQLLARQPNDAAKHAVVLGVVVRREGLLCKEVEYLALLHDIVPTEETVNGEVRAIDPEDRQVLIDRALTRVQRLCAQLPPVPCTPAQFKALEKFALDVDRWRPSQKLPQRGIGRPIDQPLPDQMSFIDRCYSAAADAGIDVQQPDDFGDYASDDLASLERANARGTEEVVSAEPLTEEEAKAEAMGPIRDIAKKYAEEIAGLRGTTTEAIIEAIDKSNGTPPILWMTEADAVQIPNGVILDDDDQNAAFTCWPAHVDPSFGPTDERNVAVAVLLG